MDTERCTGDESALVVASLEDRLTDSPGPGIAPRTVNSPELVVRILPYNDALKLPPVISGDPEDATTDRPVTALVTLTVSTPALGVACAPVIALATLTVRTPALGVACTPVIGALKVPS
jgi:hypothetical protein